MKRIFFSHCITHNQRIFLFYLSRNKININIISGVGVVLITVSGIAWRMTSRDAPSCRAMMGLDPHAEFGIGVTGGGGDSRFLPARGIPFPRSGGASHHPYAGMLYSEFQYRPPPPSYQASMLEYRLRLLLMDRGTAGGPPTNAASVPPQQGVVSPPPAYRGALGFRGLGLLPPLPDVSRPPSYRSRASDPSSHHHLHNHPAMVHHARHSSQLSYLSQQTIQEDPKVAVVADNDTLEHASVVPVLHNSGVGHTHKASIIIQQDGNVCNSKDNNYIANIQNQFDSEHHQTSTKGKSGSNNTTPSRHKNDVTIVQKEEEIGANVVVTVSASVDRHSATGDNHTVPGYRHNTSSNCSTPEVDILAHL